MISRREHREKGAYAEGETRVYGVGGAVGSQAGEPSDIERIQTRPVVVEKGLQR